MNNRFEIKAKSYMFPIMQWAHANGIKFWTVNDQRKALARYELFRAKFN